MKLHYYAETNSLYIELLDEPSVNSREIAEGVVIDFDANDRIVGIDVDSARQLVNLAELEIRMT